MRRLTRPFIAIVISIFSLASYANLKVGAEQFEAYLPLLKGKRIGLLVNQTSRVNQQHLVDALLAKGVDIKFIFAPEHGFRGDHDAGAKVESSIDVKTGIPLVSIYGKNKKPDKKKMQQLDVVIFDIQDVGVRFYTYISSMHYMMEAAAENNVELLVLDRPNPNGSFVDGPILEHEFKSFVGMHPIPTLHGMTVAEIARMINGERWLAQQNIVSLHTVPVANYTRDMNYSLPIKPSPNLPNDQSIQLYPSLCFFEATPVSIGRGTPFPFQVMGHDKITLGEFTFTPVSTPGASLNPKLKDIQLRGINLQSSPINGLDLKPLINAQKQFSDASLKLFTRAAFMDKLAGTDKLRKAIEQGQSEQQIKASWKTGLTKFKAMRKPYLLYPDL